MKKLKFSKKLLICLLIFLLIFVIAMCIIFYITGSEPATLISCVFVFCGLEGGILGWIKTSETKIYKEENNENQLETETDK